MLRLLALGAILAAHAARSAPPDGIRSVPPQIVLMEGAGRRLAFIAEKSTQKFHVYEVEGSRVRLRETLPCTTGKVSGDKLVEGDLKTPEGAYVFLRYIDGSQLPPLYGAGAWVMDYPNPFDLSDRKTGSGIWMHGVETDDRVHVARDTRGCVALANAEITRLRREIRLHETPIVVVEALTGVDPARVTADAASLRDWVEGWRRAWESKDMDRYLAHYDPGFVSEGGGLQAWARRKREVAAREGARRIGIGEITAVREKDRWRIAFRQEYAAGAHRDAGRKTLFVRGSGPESWRIVAEQWRGLGERFRLLDLPPQPQEPMTPALVAAIAPDAAAAPGKPSPRAPAEPEASLGAPEPGARPPEAGAPGPDDAPAPPAAPGVTPSEDPPPPVAAAAPAPAPPQARRARLAARLEPPGTTRRTYALLAPHVQREGEALLLQVQLLNMRATSVRSGALTVILPGAAGAPQPEPFSMKQGRLIALSLPDVELPARLRAVVHDDAGNVALDQVILVEELP